MKIKITLSDIPRTPLLEKRIAKKSQKLNPFFGKRQAFGLKWHCRVLEEGVYCVEVHSSGFSFPFHAKAQGDKLYKAMDSALGKIRRQLKRRREKKHSSRKELNAYRKVA